VLAQNEGLITSDEYERIRDLLDPVHRAPANLEKLADEHYASVMLDEGKGGKFYQKGFAHLVGGIAVIELSQRVDWSRPLEPGPVKIDAPSDERRLCEEDAQHLGVAYMVDGKRVHPSRVVVFEIKRTGDTI